VVSVDLEEFQEQMAGPGRTEGSQRTTGRDQRESGAEPEGNQGGSEGGNQAGPEMQARRKCPQPEGVEHRKAE